MQHLSSSGGIVFIILLLFSVLASAVILAKLWQFYFALGGSDKPFKDAFAALQQRQQPADAVWSHDQKNIRQDFFQHALKNYNDPAVSADNAKNDNYRHAKSLLHTQNAYLRVLEVIASLSPLLGLFGTVLGMITAFKAMEVAGSQVDASVLSGGIWQALLTTAAGLAVAIPVSLFHSWFERRVELASADIENDLEQIYLLQSQAESVQQKTV